MFSQDKALGSPIQRTSVNRLVTQNVNVDELDYLAKRLESFCTDEDARFQAMAFKFCLSDIKDFINLTFCCQQATVITDFSNLEQAGKSHSLTINGGSMPMEEFNQVDGQAVALDLIQGGAGVVTPYGVVYDNGMELEQIYTGGPFPQYLYGDSVLTLGVDTRRAAVSTREDFTGLHVTMYSPAYSSSLSPM